MFKIRAGQLLLETFTLATALTGTQRCPSRTLRSNSQRSFGIEVQLTAEQIHDAISIFQLTFSLEKVVAEQARLQILIPSSEAHSAPGPNHLIAAVILDSIGLQATTSNQQRDVACSREALQSSVKSLLISLQFQFLGRTQRSRYSYRR